MNPEAITETIATATAGKYRDQFGMPHDCWVTVEAIEVTRTDEMIEREYYGHTWKDHVWVSATGRRFAYHSPTDYGGSGYWTDMAAASGDRRSWVRKRDRIGTWPLVPPDHEALEPEP